MTTLLAVAVGLMLALPLGSLIAIILDAIASDDEAKVIDRHLPFEDMP